MTAPRVPSVFPRQGMVPLNHEGYHVDVTAASGARVSSAVDLLRFVAGIDGRTDRPDILGAALAAEMTSDGPVVCGSGACHYAFGWLARPTRGDATWRHTGSLPGTTSILVRSYHDFSWVALFNARLEPGFTSELDVALRDALARVTSFPTHDLFSTFR